MTTYGFELVQEREIAELRTQARLYKHAKTGAQLLALANDDENKVFGVTFRTPPSDSTGVAHILEHSVLGGSQKYPVKDPFSQMAKGSLKTFINAFTFGDKTVYPVASQNAQDFDNLVSVYLDAVFFPRISPETLAQEGWHYEMTAPDAPLTYRGIVFNEMKGVYSSPEGALGRYVDGAVFPDVTYGHDSGGDPRHIPDLTYEQFRAFYDQFYNPFNARIVLYGDFAAPRCLALIDSTLARIEPRVADSSVGLQPRFSAPRWVEHTFDAGQDAANAKRAMVNTTWLLGEVTDPVRAMAYDVLSHVLIGTSAAPLRKALIDSGLGEELVASGMSVHQREWTFSIGLKNIAADDAPKVEALVVETLRGLAAKPLDGDLIGAALNTLEFNLRERNTGAFPRGIAIMLTAVVQWLYDRDPFDALAFEAPLAALKAKLAGGRLLEDLIANDLVANPHRATVVMKPVEGQSAREEADEQARLAAARARMDAAEVERIVRQTRELKAQQEAPDSPEALATLPMLKLSDLERRNKRIPLQPDERAGVSVLMHDLFTSGIVYLDVGFNLAGLPAESLPFLPLFGRALLEMGTEREDYTKLALRISRETGGMGRSTMLDIARDGALQSWFFLRGKATAPQAGALLAIMRDVLLGARFDNPARFKQIVMQEKARAEAGVVPAGNAVAAARLRANFNLADWAGEQSGGASYLFFIRELAQRIERDWASIVSHLEAIRRRMVRRGNMLCNVALDADNYGRFAPQLASMIGELPDSAAPRSEWALSGAPVSEGLTIPAKVNYVAKGDNIYRHGYTTSGSASVATHLLSRDFVHERVRVQGGAYGGGCSFDRHTGMFMFSSYRDPNLLVTVKNFDDAAQFLRTAAITDDELSKHIVGVIGQIDGYMLPDAKGYASLARHLTGDSEEFLQQRREEVLATTVRDVRAFADIVATVAAQGITVVVGSADAIEAANRERGDWLKVTTLL
ncbi:MAG: insulinase family protein [Chloroflexi bacterium]|nr:insulinase family protein [Chloroflexota bacterium]